MTATSATHQVVGGGMLGLSPGGLEALLCTVVAMVVLRVELQRRGASGPNLGSMQVSWCADSAKRLLKECVPEAALLLSCLTLAALLRSRGDTGFLEAVQPGGEQEQEAWEAIKAEWPILLTADTLLALQAMLRLVVLLSVVLRLGSAGAVPLSDEASALWLGAGLARVALVARTSSYMLDGPLGGMMPAACEIAVLPILFVLSRHTLRRAPLSVGVAVAAAAVYASRNRLALSDDDPLADSLFILAHTLDTLAAFAYLVRTALIDGSAKDVSVGFTHLLLPIQQGFAAYYFLVAFAEMPQLVGKGVPFETLHIGNVAAFGAYLGACALFFAERFDGGRPIAGTV
mmetsp:Transcript_12088/g.32380  ORF Transcript_12088/g.32380 Transcript_12088/m.32380 type:complete len:345 (+) Transcript_12088:100-1134(+)|eukprot:CAMPEP_0177212404 /NCGR_PEP_ID=MMETSP0367-20130122/32618_1 /TAXON_ID=447022 ORGANISM="Scrippsiella hangoei-like, Strain SHHI-4" /NCGR_SAMPLE_ID=MMETSP0367 /ASSEMBLY_ACC=CAM_ASM_000362 /LENGTH=344 /DNA_ID=CAMNT_0018661675 /DNA_START=100 /DNA_END=1134 /DNA_ORIENTATION=-